MPWYDLIPTSGPQQTLDRARSALGRKTIYDLGSGGMKPGGPLDKKCDCSGFVAWAIGIPRQIPPGTGGWLDTDAYARGGAPAFPGLAVPVAPSGVQPGDIYVYPDYKLNGVVKQGHIGIISAVQGGVPTKVIHCSLSNSNAGDAVKETGPTAWVSKGGAARIMRLDYTALQAKYAPGHVHVMPLKAVSPAKAPLKHALLAGHAGLQAIAAGNGGVLRATGGQVDGAGQVQDALNHLGSKYADLKVALGNGETYRGTFGPKTEQAVENFQASHGIKPDGLVGKDTLRSLDAALASFDANGVDRTRKEAFSAENQKPQDFRKIFIGLIAPAAQSSAKATGVPASITIAQAALESNWGRSGLSVKALNFFGIKGKGPAGSVTMPTAEYVGGKRIAVNAAFRVYKSMEQSCEDHARLIATATWSKSGLPIYAEAMKHTKEPRKFAAALEGVYATDPEYAEKLWDLMDRYELQQYDV